MRNLAAKNVEAQQFIKFSHDYRKLIVISALFGLVITMAYLHIINSEFDLMLFTVPIGIGAILVSAQFGFISLTFLSLQGADQQVAKMNLTVLVFTALFTLPIITGMLVAKYFIYIIVVAACVCFMLRNILAGHKTQFYLN
jgi:hypothetical protein